MHKVVYNACYGGFSLSIEAVNWLAKHATDSKLKAYTQHKLTGQYFYIGDLVGSWFDDKRHHKDLVAVVEALGGKASGSCAKLKITEISGNQYRIDEYDGAEEVITPEGSDWIIIED